MLRLNRYALIMDINKDIHIITGAMEKEIILHPTEGQRSLIDRLMSNEAVSREELSLSLGEENVNALCSCGALITENSEVESIYSRTDAYFEAYGMKEARKRLSEKDVIILGCGGIGTHMAWHFATLGVRSITLLDFDSVEESNLNRQILFDRNDIGNSKTTVLKEKLSAINSEISISTINQRVTSEEQLEKILTAAHYDLIVKALDSPAEFSLWLDRICKKHHLTYISGITLRDNALIGPTYIPGKSKIGWSEILPSDNNSHKLYGTAPSLGTVLYHISDELAIEALKILTGYGIPKYMDKVLFRNIITGEEHVIGSEEPSEKTVSEQNSSVKEIFLSVVVIILLTISGANFWPMLIVAPVASIAMPFMMYSNKYDIMKMTFITTTIYALTMFAMCIFSGLFSMLASSMVQAVILTLIAFGVVSIVILAFCSINYMLCQLRKIR